MSGKLKRYFAPFIVNSKIDGLHQFQNHVFPADENGEIVQGSEIETSEIWLASNEDLERLHDLLCQVLNKPRSLP